jgi:fibronectin-binding autotransporter adhesin
VLSGSNNYSGATTLTAGTLQANNVTNPLGTGLLNLNGGTLEALLNTTLGNSSYTIGSGATATIGGTNNLTLSNAGSFGNSTSALNIANTAGTKRYRWYIIT